MDKLVKYRGVLSPNQRMEAEKSNNKLIRMAVKDGDECHRNNEFHKESSYHRYVIENLEKKYSDDESKKAWEWNRKNMPIIPKP